MTIKDQIIAASKMGYSAILDCGQVAAIAEGSENTGVLVTEDQWFRAVELRDEEIEEHKIIGYLYAGQLAGSEPIPEGQRFRVKETGEIFTTEKMDDNGDHLRYGWDGNQVFNKSEIEPYFAE